MDSVSFHVLGIPMPKGSTTRMPNGAMLPAGTAASRKRMIDWRSDIRSAAISAMGEREPSRACIRFMCEFQLPYPVSLIRKYQLGWYPHIKKPDVDKLLRSMLDALTGIVWVDDSQVSFATMNKTYAWNGRPGAHVVVDFLDDSTLQRIGSTQQWVTDVMETL